MEVCPPRPRLIYVLSSFIFINITYCGHRRQFITSSIYTNTIVFFFRMLRLRVLALSLLLGCNHCNADPVARKQIVNIFINIFPKFSTFLSFACALWISCSLFNSYAADHFFSFHFFSAKNNQTYLKTSRRRLIHSQEPASKPPLTRCRWPAPTSTPTRTGPSLLPMATRALRCSFFFSLFWHQDTFRLNFTAATSRDEARLLSIMEPLLSLPPVRWSINQNKSGWWRWWCQRWRRQWSL